MASRLDTGDAVKKEWDEWLDPDNHNPKALKDLLNPFPNDGIDYYQVSKAVNNMKNYLSETHNHSCK